jgi:hypothetical protein
LKKSLRAIERAFAEIESALAGLSTRVRRAERQVSRRFKPIDRAVRRIDLSPKRRAQLKLQGAYMGYVRQLKPALKARVKEVKVKRGFEAAIRVAKRLTR